MNLRRPRLLDRDRLRRWWEECALNNVFSLYGAYLVNYAVPLFTIPYLVRELGASAWGLVAMAQGLGNYMNLVVEYGFGLSATRELARHQDSPERVSELLAGVTGAKLILAVAAIGVALLVQNTVPALESQRAVLWAGVIAGIALGLSPMWYFTGCERMHVIAAIEIVSKIAAAAGVFIFIHGPADAWRVPGLQAAASLFSTGLALALAYRETRGFRITPQAVLKALRQGWTMFLFRSSGMLYTSGNSFLLGLFAPPQIVGYFAGAEKIAKAFMGLLNPFNQALYPRLNRLLKTSPQQAVRLFRTNAVVVGAGGLLLGACVFFGAPLLVRILLGRALEPAVPVLRWLAILPPLIGMNTVLSTQWMAPLNLDATLNWIITGAGVLNVCLAFLLAPRYQQMGMAWAVICAELFIAFACGLVLYRHQTGGMRLAASPLPIPDLENPA